VHVNLTNHLRLPKVSSLNFNCSIFESFIKCFRLSCHVLVCHLHYHIVTSSTLSCCDVPYILSPQSQTTRDFSRMWILLTVVKGWSPAGHTSTRGKSSAIKTWRSSWTRSTELLVRAWLPGSLVWFRMSKYLSPNSQYKGIFLCYFSFGSSDSFSFSIIILLITVSILKTAKSH